MNDTAARSALARHAAAMGIALALALAGSRAGAADDKRACAAAYEQAQELRQSGKLIEARVALITCSQPTCPAAAVADCGPWLAEVEASLPSVVIAARDASGRESSEVRVLVDGRPFAASLDGKALPIDPGAHVFRYEPAQGPAVEERVLIRQGEKNRAIVIALGAPPRSGEAPGRAPASSGRPVPALTWAFGATGLAGLAVFAGFGVASLGAEANLRATCAPHCPLPAIDAIRTQHTVADIGLGVSVVSLGAAALVLFTQPKAGKARPALSVRPFVGARAAGLEGAF